VLAQEYPEPTVASLEMVSILIKISQMNIFTDLSTDEMLRGQFFWNSLASVSAKNMASEL
jgi:hypothetical protein